MKKIILKYAVIVLAVIILLFSGVLYICNVTLVKQYTEKDVIEQIESRQTLAAQMHQTLFQRVQSNIESLLSSEDIFALADSSGLIASPLTKDQIDWIYNIRQQLQDIIVLDDSIQSIYVHFWDSNYIIASEHYESNMWDFYDQNWVESVEEMKKTGKIPTFLAGSVRFETDYRKWSYDCVRYIFQYSSYITDEKVLIVVNYNKSALNELFQSSDPKQDTVILNSQDQIVYDSVNDSALNQLFTENYDKICYSARTQKQMMLDDQYLLTFVEDSYQNTFINIAEYQSLFSEYDTLLLSVYGIVSLVIFLAGVAWYIATIRIYSPVSRAVQSIYRLSDSLKLESPANDAMIDKAVAKLVEQVKNTEELRQEQLFFDKVLLHSEDLQENQYLNRQFYSAVCILIDDIAGFQWEGQTKELVLNLIAEILSENQVQSIGKIVSQNCFEFLLSFDMVHPLEKLSDGESEPAEYYNQKAFESIQQKIQQILSHTATIGVGEVYHSIRYLPFSLEEARLRADRRILLGKNQIICESEEKTPIYLPAEETKRLIRAIEQQDLAEVDAVFHQLSTKVHNQTICLSAKGMPSFIGYLVFELSRFDAQRGGSSVDAGVLYQKATSLETFDEIIEYFREFIHQYIETCSNLQTEEISILQKAARFIRSNYQKDIDVNTVAENIGVSYSRLRRMILEEFGINIVDYINTMRIEEAKKLLCTTTHTLTEIATAVGYNNEQSLTRYFKKFEGCSPGEYRKRASSKTENA
ncbi:MAG: helix-turn-helix domain-containing protein [Candidatus Merdivicinus sp.]